MPNRASELTWQRDPSHRDGHGDAAAAGAERRGLTREAIVGVAIRIADADGFDAVSIRRVATELGVRPMSLYTHIAAKADLAALMANELVGLMLVEDLPSGDWREALREIARRTHATFKAHPWALEAFARRPRLGPNVVLHAKQMARAVSSLPLTPEEVWTVLGIVDDYVLGHALRVATSGNARDLDEILSADDLAEFPELAVLSEVDIARASEERFELGLQTVLDGVEQRYLRDGRRTGGSRRPRRRAG